MKRKFKFILLPLLALLLFIGFTSWDNGNSSIRGGGYSIMDKFFDLVQKENQEVRTWIEDWNKLAEESNSYKKEYRNLIADNEEYYNEARRTANALKDATLKTKAIAMIDASEENYKKKAVAIKDQLAQLDKKEQQMLEQFAVLKIKYTIPKMEILQVGLIADEIKFQNRMKAYETLIGKSNKMME